MSILLQLLSPVNITAFLIFLAVYLCLNYIFNRPTDVPPGPRIRLPLLGNLAYIAGKDPRDAFADMRRQYGDVFGLYTDNGLMVVLNGHQAIRDALVLKSSVFSGRPDNYLNRVVQKYRGLALSKGTFWHEQRKFTLQHLKENAFTRAQLEERISNEVTVLVSLLQTKVGQTIDIGKYLKSCVFNILTQITMSQRFDYDDSEPWRYLKALHRVLEVMNNTGLLVNSFPFLEHVPGDPLHMKEMHDNTNIRMRFINKFYEQHIASFDRNCLRDFMDMYIAELEESKKDKSSSFSHGQMLFVIGDLINAGTDTTDASLQWTIYYLQKYPQIQKKLQKEILKVIGNDHAPTLEDQKNLHYIEAIFMEALRLDPPVPFALPHDTDEEVNFYGYRIPKGSTIIPNLHSAMTDPSVWNNPFEFQPERFLDEDGCLSKPEAFVPFSMGRRICLGEVLAKANLFLILTTLYQKFSFVCPDGANQDINNGELGLTLHPKPFQVRVVEGQL